MLAVRCYMKAMAQGARRGEGWFSLLWAVGFYLCWGFVWGRMPRYPAWQFYAWFFAWWGVSLPFAISGLRRGNSPNRICAGISMLAFALVVYALFREGSSGV
jgi:hypothetical protein